MGSSMPSPTLRPSASHAPLLAASIAPGPPPVMHGEARLDQAPPHQLAEGVRRVVGADACRPEDRDGGAELGERAEALDELRLHPQHPPRVLVDQSVGPRGVQQPLVGGLPASTCERRWTTGP